MNYFPLGIVGGGPAQDIFDSQAANIAGQFLGISHVNCLLCHNGNGHLNQLSLWASQTTRVQAWGFAAFLAHTWTRWIATPQDPNNPNTRYNFYSLQQYAYDYALNTTTGNRPARQPIGSVRAITPAYLWGGQTVPKGWTTPDSAGAVCDGRLPVCARRGQLSLGGIFREGHCGSTDQFDPARLDPDNPPALPWVLQPTNARLLNALAQAFIDSGYDLKAIMRLIRELGYLSTCIRVSRRVESGVGTVFRTQVRSAPVGGRGS